MKAFTLWEPWATLIAIGAKPYEFRSWPAPKYVVGQRIAIHAGARPVRLTEVEDLLARENSPEHWSTALKRDIALPFLTALHDKMILDRKGSHLPMSHIVCTAVVGEPVLGWKIAKEFGGQVNDSDRDQYSNWAWPMLDVRPIQPPIPMKGAQGLWNCNL